LGSQQKTLVLQTRAGRMLCGINNSGFFKLRLLTAIRLLETGMVRQEEGVVL